MLVIQNFYFMKIMKKCKWLKVMKCLLAKKNIFYRFKTKPVLVCGFGLGVTNAFSLYFIKN